jgi:hypothetical protein
VAAGSRSLGDQLALLGGHVLWRVVGVAAGAIGYVAEAGFELEMRRVSSRSARLIYLHRPRTTTGRPR